MLKAARTNCFRPVVLLSFLVLLTILAYLRSVHAPLILDDFLHIKPSRLRGALTDFSLHFRSVAMFSFRLNYYLSGMNLVAFRITNIIFHVLSACLASYLTYITLTLHSTKMAYQKLGEGKTPLHIALFVAMLFLLHPIQTSAVNYLTQRMAIMACFFSFSGIIFYIKGVNATKWKISLCYYVLSSFSF
ncbi:MAG TPA: hypothetical protein VEI28_03150, partial [Thermodesulfovibrionales bacterium]|nr:hypothetical protein [Thermodesulfovibrionales bacterium]